MNAMKKTSKSLLSIVVIAAVAGGVWYTFKPQGAIDMVIVSWGGAYTASQQKAYHDPYMRNNPGVNIVNDDSSNEGVAKLRAMNETGKVTWSLVDVVGANSISLCDEGLVEEIDHDTVLASAPDGTSATEDFGDLIVSPCFIPQIVYSTAFAYRTDLVKVPPTTINDVFDLAKIPGKRSLERSPVYNLEWALIADGVPANRVYQALATDAGVERAFKKLDTIKGSVVWWEKGSQTPQLLADGEVVIGSSYNGRLFSVIEEEKQPIAMMWDWQAFDLDGWVIPKGAPHRAEVLKYVRFATDTQRLADQAKYISYGPARKSSAPLVGKHATLDIDMLPHMPTAPANSAHTLLTNYKFWADNRDDLTERFNAWLAN